MGDILFYAVLAAIVIFGGTALARAGTRAIPFEEHFTRLSAATGVPKRLMVSIVAHESAFNPRAENEEAQADRRKGRDVDSLGLGQVLWPDTARALEPGLSRVDLFDPAINLRLAYAVMKGNLRMFPFKDPDGFAPAAVAAYNGGPRAVRPDGSFSNPGYVALVRAKWRLYADV